jgi:hypothetical protein
MRKLFVKAHQRAFSEASQLAPDRIRAIRADVVRLVQTAASCHEACTQLQRHAM